MGTVPVHWYFTRVPGPALWSYCSCIIPLRFPIQTLAKAATATEKYKHIC